MTGRLSIPVQRRRCEAAAADGTRCCLLTEHRGSHLPDPERRAHSANDPIEAR